jgi:predicted RNase H-like HicB family nuclease
MKKDRYAYFAVLSYDLDGITVEFPDLPGCITCGDNEEEALKNAQEALGLHLWGMEKDNDEIPTPTSRKNINPQENEAVTLVSIYMLPVRDRLNNKATKITLTIPQWLKTEAEHENVNFSHLLQAALKEKLGHNGP